MARSHLDGHPNGHGIDGAETEPHQTFNSGNGNCYHSTLINVEGNPDIMEVNMEVSKRTKPKGYDINKEQYSDSNGGKNLQNQCCLDVYQRANNVCGQRGQVGATF